jgi:hypothetical protein
LLFFSYKIQIYPPQYFDTRTLYFIRVRVPKFIRVLIRVRQNTKFIRVRVRLFIRLIRVRVRCFIRPNVRVFVRYVRSNIRLIRVQIRVKSY